MTKSARVSQPLRGAMRNFWALSKAQKAYDKAANALRFSEHCYESALDELTPADCKAFYAWLKGVKA